MKKYIMLMLVLAVLLTGCGNSDYNKAMTLYEAGKYEEAIVLFLELGDYEDSAEKLVDCQYQMAVAAYKSEDYAVALNMFTALGDYGDAPEYRRDAAWKALHVYIEENGEKLESTTKISYVNKSVTGQVIQTDLATVASNPEQLILYNGDKIDVMGIQAFSDLAITVTRGNPEAKFQMSSQVSGLKSKTTGDGTLNISSATANTQLNPSNYLYAYTDIYGKSHSETEMDSTDRAALQEHYTHTLEGVSAILGQTGLGITLADLGFEAMG